MVFSLRPNYAVLKHFLLKQTKMSEKKTLWDSNPGQKQVKSNSSALADVAKLVSCLVVIRTIYLSQIWTSRMR